MFIADEIPFVWFLKRDQASCSSSTRGVARPEVPALTTPVHGTGIEKLWIAAVDGLPSAAIVRFC